MEITNGTTRSGATVVRPKGPLDLMAAPAVRQHLNALVQKGEARLVMDLTDVELIDSTGLGALISGLKAARKNGGDLLIANPNDSVKAMLALTSLDWVLRSCISVDEAFM